MSLVRGLSSLTVYHDQKRMDDGEDLTFNIHAPPPARYLTVRWVSKQDQRR